MLCEVPLTKEQQEFAAEHHGLVYKFLNDNHLCLKCGRRRSSFMLPGSSTILNGSVLSPLTQNIGQKY